MKVPMMEQECVILYERKHSGNEDAARKEAHVLLKKWPQLSVKSRVPPAQRRHSRAHIKRVGCHCAN